MRKIIPIIKVSNCMKALNYYCDIFNAKTSKTILSTTNLKEIEMAEIIIDENFTVLLEQTTDEKNYNEGVSLILEFDTQDELKTIYKKLAIDGFVLCPLQKTLRGPQHAVVKDLFDVTWQLKFSI